MESYKSFFQLFQDFFFTFLDTEVFQVPFYLILVSSPLVLLVRIWRHEG